MGKLSICLACNSHVKSNETTCPHCGAGLQQGHAFAPRSSAILLGLALTGCPAGDDGETSSTVADTGSTSNVTTISTTIADTGSSSITVTTDQSDLDSAYGTPETGESFTTSPDSTSTGGTGTDTTGDSTGSSTSGDTGSSTGDATSVGEPEYGVPETG